MNSNTNGRGGIAQKLGFGAAFVVACVVGLATSAMADVDSTVSAAAISGGTDMGDTMVAIALAMIPLAIGVLVAKRAFRVISGFFR